jgi:hypothetical protein
MSDSFDVVKGLWEKAKPVDKENYLFQALACMRTEFLTAIENLQHTCDCRLDKCKNNFVTKSQARLIAIIILALAVGIGIGTGYLTVKELITHIPKV